MTQPEPQGLWRPTVTLWVLLGAFVLLLASMIVGSLRRPQIPYGAITPPHPVPIGDTLVGPATVTLDATASDRWTFFDFSRNSVVEHPGPLDWDLAVRRFYVIANGGAPGAAGAGFAGQGGIADLGPEPFDSVRVLPARGYLPNDRDSTNDAIRRWYDYGWASHLLRSKNHVYAVKTADGKYAKVQIVSYYCAGAQPGCLTLRYVFQGNGSPNVAVRRQP